MFVQQKPACNIKRSGVFLLLVSILGISSKVSAETLNIAVASNFIAPLQQIAKEFELKTNHQLKISAGSSGKFFAQIQNGAPFQILLSADALIPERLINANLAQSGTQFTYAIGKLVLWSSTPGLVKDSAEILSTDKFKKIAIANPARAPYGAAALETLSKLGLAEQVKKKAVWGENIAQTYQFALSGNAELGFVAASQVLNKEGQFNAGSGWRIPDEMYAPIVQDAVLMHSAKDSNAAMDFLQFLQGDRARKIIEDYGYAVPVRTTKNVR